MEKVLKQHRSRRYEDAHWGSQTYWPSYIHIEKAVTHEIQTKQNTQIYAYIHIDMCTLYTCMCVCAYLYDL